MDQGLVSHVEGARLLSDVGEALFGRALRLRVAEWVLKSSDPDFFAALVADDLRVPASNVGQEIDRLEGLGMIERVAGRRGDRAKRFVRLNSPLWAVIQAAIDAVEFGIKSATTADGTAQG